MSSLWKVSVINKGQKWVDLEVNLDHPDAGSFAEDPVFALSLLLDKAYGFNDKYEYIPASALGNAFNHDDVFNLSFLKSRVSEFVEKIIIYKAVNVPFDESDAHEKVNEQTIASGVEDEDDERWDEVWGDFWRDFWNNPDNLPSAKYRIWVTDEKWIEHMTVGLSFDTASYSDYGPWIDENRDLDLEEEKDGQGRNGVPGFRKSEIPPRATTMNAQMIRMMAENHSGFSKEELQQIINDHQVFIESGGGEGAFMKLEAAGMPMNIYQGFASDGKQLEVRMKKFDPQYSLSGVNLAWADFAGALCENVDFSGAILDGSVFTDSFLANANFEGASLRNVDFTGSDLSNASFRNAVFESTDFEIANCAGADFTGVNLHEGVFPGANLDGVKR